MPWNKPYKSSQNQRLDSELYTCANRVYFMTVRTYETHSPFVREDLSRLVLDILRQEQERQSCSVFTYCLMPNHLHFLVSPDEDGISVLTFTERFKGKSTNFSWKLGWQGKLWQPRYYDHIVRTQENLLAIAEYILNNPVRQGLVEVHTDWMWSGHFTPLPFP